MGNTEYLQICIRILLIIINSFIIYFSYQTGYTITILGAITALVFQVFLLLGYLKNIFLDVEKAIDCLLHEDYLNTISAKKRKNSLHNKTALLLEKCRKQSLEKKSEELILTNIIESLSIGVLILRKGADNNIEVFQLNNAFINFLKIPKFYKWNLLKTKITSIADLISEWKTIRHVVSLQINNESESFFLKTSVTQTNQYDYLIISLETIQQLIDKKEKEAWYKLMNVMSHEIINTITPISSLAENLDSLLHDQKPDNETLEELSQGLKIIKKRSHHLTSFVGTYRKLAELPLPEKEAFCLTTLIKNILTLFTQQLENENITMVFNSSLLFKINADKKQIEQVVINLLSNCIHALKSTSKPIINIEIEKENNRTSLTVSDNGIGISDAIKDKIFVPYFTTRKNGSGIGLTLSKNIIEAHKGTIYYNSKKEKTTFVVSFI